MAAFLADEPFDAPNLIYEAHWDGLRSLLLLRDGQVRFLNRTGRDLTPYFPEIRGAEEALKAREAVLDGAIVVLTGGKPDPEAAQERLNVSLPVQRSNPKSPAVYIAFDLLMLDGTSLLGEKLRRRKELLKGILRQTPHLVLGTWVPRTGEAFLKQVNKVGIKAVVGKDVDSVYEPGARSRSWLRMQRTKEQDCVICGFTEGMGRREGLLGAIVLGVYRDGKLTHAGQVGSGFDHPTLIQIHRKLAPLVTDEPPFDEIPRIERSVTWARPELVCEVQYQEWTADRKLRSPRFVRLRDQDPERCEVVEVAAKPRPDEVLESLSA
jgi:bifunctional non-homologous end joining protein LigD